MITTLNIKCPHCGQVSQIFLSTAVSVIILNCPSCFSPIMYFRRKIFLLDQKQLKKLTGDFRSTAVINLMEQLDGVGTLCSTKNPARHIENARAAVSVDRCAIDQPEEKYITGDDCTNLRIELELCRDSKAFIDIL